MAPEGRRLRLRDLLLGVGRRAPSLQQAARAVDERDQAGAGALADRGVALPVPEALAALGLGRPLRYRPGPGDLAALLLAPVLAVPALSLVAQPALEALAVRRSSGGSSLRSLIARFLLDLRRCLYRLASFALNEPKFVQTSARLLTSCYKIAGRALEYCARPDIL